MRPKPFESHPWFHPYIAAVPEDNGIDALLASEKVIQRIFGDLTPEQWAFRYQAFKWSPKQMLGHLIDAERIFAYRALCIARGDTTSLPGFEETDYAAAGKFDDRSGHYRQGAYRRNHFESQVSDGIF